MTSCVYNSKCPVIRTSRMNLCEAQEALGEKKKNFNKPYVKKYKEEQAKLRYCYVCEDLQAAARNAVLKAIKKNIKKLRFNKTELSILVRLYLELLGGDMDKELTIQDFKQFLISTLGILDSHALDGISRAVKTNSRGKTISLDEFLHALSVLLRGSLNERIEFAFKVMDFDADGFLRKNNEISNLLVGSFDPQIAALNPDLDAEEPERDTVNYLHQRLINANPVVSFEDFKEKVLQEPLLLECLIAFLPSPEKSTSFQQVLFSDVVVTDQWLTNNPHRYSKVIQVDDQNTLW